MKTVGVTRPVDKMGRVVIPKEIREQLHIENDIDKFEIFMEDGKVILQKFQPACVFCKSLIETVNYKDYTVCTKCIEALNSIKDQAE